MNSKKQHRTSLKDLAKELNVSIATVSRALRSSTEIGEEMQKKVKELAKKMNYRPNPFAQSLRKEAPKIIGVVVPNLVTHYYAAVLTVLRMRREGQDIVSSAPIVMRIATRRRMSSTTSSVCMWRASSLVFPRRPLITAISRRSPRWASPWCSSGVLVCQTCSPV